MDASFHAQMLRSTRDARRLARGDLTGRAVIVVTLRKTAMQLLARVQGRRIQQLAEPLGPREPPVALAADRKAL